MVFLMTRGKASQCVAANHAYQPKNITATVRLYPRLACGMICGMVCVLAANELLNIDKCG
jgi:hypothetical protein